MDPFTNIEITGYSLACAIFGLFIGVTFVYLAIRDLLRRK